MRSVPEWIGKTDDEALPPRVRLRIFFRDNGRCKVCNRWLRAGDKAEFDHVIALANGGENRESNIQLLCAWCHKRKTTKDVAEKSAMRRKQAKHIGIKQKRRPMPGSRASGWKRRMDGGIERR